MWDDKEERIRAEAYRRWEQEGRPEGQHDRHWHEAAEAMATGGSVPVESEGTTQALKVLKPRAATKSKAEKAAPKAKVEKPAEIKAPKAVAAKVVAPTAVVTEAPKRPRAKKVTAE